MKEMLEAEFTKHQASTSNTAIHPPVPKTPKPHLSQFDGSNPLDWLFQAEQFFELTQTPPHQRLTYVPFYVQGLALVWFKWMHANHQLTTWEQFTSTLEHRFGPSTYENHQVALFKLKQAESVWIIIPNLKH